MSQSIFEFCVPGSELQHRKVPQSRHSVGIELVQRQDRAATRSLNLDKRSGPGDVVVHTCWNALSSRHESRIVVIIIIAVSVSITFKTFKFANTVLNLSK